MLWWLGGIVAAGFILLVILTLVAIISQAHVSHKIEEDFRRMLH